MNDSDKWSFFTAAGMILAGDRASNFGQPSAFKGPAGLTAGCAFSVAGARNAAAAASTNDDRTVRATRGIRIRIPFPGMHRGAAQAGARQDHVCLGQQTPIASPLH